MIGILCIVMNTQVLAKPIVVYAGPDSGFCEDDQFELASLEASISGLVDDGTWISSGDGVFMPDNSGNGQLSVSQYYIPGPLDLQTGVFSLSLVSDPDPFNGFVYTDQTLIHLIGDVFPFCNAFLNVSLSEACETEINYLQLIVNPNYPIDLFNITLTDQWGNEIPNQTVGYEHIGTTIQYEAMHECSGQSCNGSIHIFDHYVPQPDCRDTIVSCLDSVLPDSLGFPIKTDSIPVKLDEFNYFIPKGDNCTDLHVHYNDERSEELCSSPYETVIERSWTLTDDYGNQSNCIETISVLRAGLDDVTFPGNYDGIDKPTILCSDNIPLDENDNPHPDYTGMPDAMHCQYLLSTYSDITFDFCGETKKINREWHIIEWCSNESMSMNQVIVLVDTLAPEIMCLDTMTISTNPYTCESLETLVPVPQVIDNCGQGTISAKLKDGNQLLDQWFSIGQDSVELPGLTMGNYSLEWIAIDDCGNDTTCVSTLVVEDTYKPFAICIQDTKVAIGSQGYSRVFASSIDNGSYDNCSLSDIKIRLLNDACLGMTEYHDFVDICCLNVGTTISVELRVTDHLGLSNYCEVNLLVEDKLAPEIYCPSDLTISCAYYASLHDLDDLGTVRENESDVQSIEIYDGINNGIVGQDGYFVENCYATISDTIVENLECDQGTVNRIFYAIDSFGNVDSCIQEITIINTDALEYDDISWPEDVVVDSCYSESLANLNYGEPTWVHSSCSMITFSSSVQVFEFTDGACVKLIRTFTLIDWCQFDGVNNEGIWEYEQIIKFENNVAPVINTCVDLDLCLYGDDCMELYHFKLDAEDDCTASDQLLISFHLINADNQNIIHQAESSEFDIELQPGNYIIEWVVEDKCGNSTECTQLVAIEDCKLPTPYCVGSVTLVINFDGVAELWTSDVDLGGEDNCTSQDQLVVSFDEFDTVLFVQYFCEDLENGVQDTFYQDLWYFDQAGNREYCTAQVIVQDNQDYCPNNFSSFDLNGLVLNSRLNPIGEVNLEIISDDESYEDSYYSADGEFAFQELPADNNYQLLLARDDSYLIGVSTLDILLIQNHILGLNPLSSPYDVYAADVDGSESVSGIDLVTMRKLILGKIIEFPNTENPWKFVKRDDELAAINPWFLSELIDIESSENENLYTEIMAMKLGDVNGTIQNIDASELESRSSERVELIIEERVNETAFIYDLSLPYTIGAVAGLEFNLGLNTDLENDIVVSSEYLVDFGDDHYNVLDNGELRVSFVGLDKIMLNKEEVFISIKSSMPLDFSLLDNIGNQIIATDKTLMINDIRNVKNVNYKDCYSFSGISIRGEQLVLNSEYFLERNLNISISDINGRSYQLNPVVVDGLYVYCDIPEAFKTGVQLLFVTIETNQCYSTHQLMNINTK